MARPPFLPQQIELANFDWRQGWRWDIRFTLNWEGGFNQLPNLPGGNGWFPAVEVAPELYVVRDYEFSGGLGNFSVPSEFNPKSFRVSFADVDGGNISGVVQRWLEDWHEHIFPRNRGFVRRLSKVVMWVDLVHLMSNLEESHRYSALVYPNGTFQPIYDSSSSVPIMIVQFVVAGMIREG